MQYEGDSEWIELGECDSLVELELVRGLLESEGIECFCPGMEPGTEWTAGIRKHRSPLLLHVRPADEAKARALLDAKPEFSASDFPAAEAGDEDA